MSSVALPGRNFAVSAQVTILHNEFENYAQEITATYLRSQWVYSWKSSDLNMHQYTRSSSVHIMACSLFGTRPLCEPILAHTCSAHGTLRNKFQWIWVKVLKNHLKLSSAKWQPLSLSHNVLTYHYTKISGNIIVSPFNSILFFCQNHLNFQVIF